MAGRLSVRVRVVALMVTRFTALPIIGAWWLTRGTEDVSGTAGEVSCLQAWIAHVVFYIVL